MNSAERAAPSSPGQAEVGHASRQPRAANGSRLKGSCQENFSTSEGKLVTVASS